MARPLFDWQNTRGSLCYNEIMYVVYILQCLDGSLYTGITTDLERRFKEHKSGKGGHYTRSHGARKMVYNEKCKNRSVASKREAEIKKMSRQSKQKLIKGQQSKSK